MSTISIDHIKEFLHAFKPIGLAELDRVALLDRTDTKYVFTMDQLPYFLDKLKPSYFILEVENRRMFHYESLYFDTKTFSLFNQHYIGKLNRYKVRFRKYIESNISYFEIKFKSNKNRTIKSRIKQELDTNIVGNALNMVKDIPAIAEIGLKAMFWVNYVRITLVSTDFKERLTLDLELTFKNDTESKSIPNLIIAELKQSKAGLSAFKRLMKDHHIREGAISKYCFGVTTLFNNMRSNNFKPQIQHINKILHAAPTGY